MRIYLDDIREPTPDGFARCYSVNEAIRLMETGHVEFASLDHDLGDFEYDGGDGIKLILWMAEHDVWPTEGIRIHSMNPVGRQNMDALIRRYGPYGF